MENKKTDKSPVVDLQVLAYDVVNSTKFIYRIGDFQKKSVLSNSVLSSAVTYTPSQFNNENCLVKIGNYCTFNPTNQRFDNIASLQIGMPLYGPLNIWKSVIN